MTAFRQRAGQALVSIGAVPILRHALVQRAADLLGEGPPSVNDPGTGHLAWLLGLCGWPVLVEPDHLGHRIVLCERFYATPIREGSFDPVRYRAGGFRSVYAADSLAVLRERVRAGLPDPLANPAGTTWAARLAWLTAQKLRKARQCVRRVGWRGLARIVCHKARARLRRLGQPDGSAIPKASSVIRRPTR
jgi:hypothetical protein